MKYIYVLAGFLFIISCKENDLESVDLRINHHKQTAIGLVPILVLLTQEKDKIGTDEWNYHCGGIIGFDYEWGYIYDLRIKKIIVDNPPADESSIKYVLEEVIAKVKQENPFKIYLKSKNKNIQDVVVAASNDEYRFLDGKVIDCSHLCESLDELLSNEDELTGVFVHTNAGTIKLQELIVE